jgi:hypothetical protein
VPEAIPICTWNDNSFAASTAADADRLCRLVFLGSRPAKIGQDAVAEVIGDIAAIAQNDGGHRVVVAPQELAQILRVVPARQFSRADEIAEHHGQLAPLCWADRFSSGRRVRGRGGFDRWPGSFS